MPPQPKRRRAADLSRALGFFAIPSDRRARRHVVLLSALLVMGGGLIAFRNLRTVGNLSGEPPLDKHVAIMGDPARLARTQGRFVHPENLPTMLTNYLRPDGVILRTRFPYFSPKPGSSVRQFAGAHLDGAEPYVSLPSAYPLWLLLAGLGLCAAFAPGREDTNERRSELRLALLGSAAGCAAPFIAVYLTLRYLHDLFPFFVIAGAVGLEWLLAMAGRRTWVRLGIAAVVLVGLYTVAVSVSVTLASSRSDLTPVSLRRRQQERFPIRAPKRHEPGPQRQHRRLVEIPCPSDGGPAPGGRPFADQSRGHG